MYLNPHYYWEKSDKYYQLSRKEREIRKVCPDQKGWSLFTSGHLDALIFGEQKTVFRTNFLQSLPRTNILQLQLPKRDGENFTLEISPKMK